MKKMIVLILALPWCSTAIGTVSLRVCEADGNTPFDSNVAVMVGSKLAFVCESDAPARYAAMSLVIADANQDLGLLSARGPYTSPHWTGSYFSEAGSGAEVTDSPTDEYGNSVNEFDMYAAQAGEGGEYPSQGDWFIIDYNATNIGNCTVKLYVYQLIDANGQEIVNPFSNPQMQAVTLSNVASRDFNSDGRVDFTDFAILSSYWLSTDCSTINNNCDGTDLNAVPDGIVDFVDVMYFAEYWLDSHRSQDSGVDMLMARGESLLFMADRSFEQMSTMGYSLPAIYLTCGTNDPNEGDEVVVYVHSDTPLFILQLWAQIIGNANLTAVMSPADCNQYGWVPGWNMDSYFDSDGWVALGGVAWPGEATGTVGYFKFIYHGGQVAVSISNEWSYVWDINSQPVPLSTEILLIGRDPNEI